MCLVGLALHKLKLWSFRFQGIQCTTEIMYDGLAGQSRKTKRGTATLVAATEVRTYPSAVREAFCIRKQISLLNCIGFITGGSTPSTRALRTEESKTPHSVESSRS